MPNQPEVRVVIVSKLTSKSQTTIPQPIRAVLGLQPGRRIGVRDRRWASHDHEGATRDHNGRPVSHLRGMALGSGHYGLCGPLERGDVIKVPFPYTDRATRQSRPAVVVSTAQLQELHGLLWVVMITSAENRGWPDDVPVANLKLAGLPVPSLIRSAKIATIDASDASKLGRVAAAQLRRVTSKIKQRLGAV